MAKHWILKNKKLTESKIQSQIISTNVMPEGKIITGKERDKILEIFNRSQND